MTAYTYQVHALNGYGGAGAISIYGAIDTYSLDDAMRAANAHRGAYVVRRPLGSLGANWERVSAAPAPAPAPAPRTYSARRIAVRFYEYTADGITPSSNDDDFNFDMTPYATDDDMHVFDSVADMVAAIRRDYVRFDAYGDGMTASDPDGSQIIDYATAARESVSWHLDAVSPALLERVIIPAVDAR